MAAFRYQKKYSEETGADSEFAQRLEERAKWLLEGVSSGTVELDDKTYTSRKAWSQDDFWPNDTTLYPNTDIPIRAFSMGAQY